MFKRFNSIRFMYIRSHLYGLFLITVILLSVFLSIFVLFDPDWLSASAIFVFTSLLVLSGICISFYAGFKSSGSLKERLDYLSVQITQYANGNYQSRIYMNEQDEITRICNELNELGEKLQNQVKSLQRMADERAEYAKSAHKSATIEERQRLARDLHDSVSQQLFALTMLCEAAINQIDRNPEIAKAQLQEVANAGLTAQTEMRALLLHLRPVYLSGDSLSEGIYKLVQEIKQKTQLHFETFIEDDLTLSETTEEHVFRIIQEALSNILRHANASNVKIDVSKRQRELFIHVRDNGKGFKENYHERKTSYGLRTMRERAEELGGTFQVRSNVDKGTYIDIRIPC